jgi:hypothetical protein
MIEPRCLIGIDPSPLLFQRDFAGSGKWFRRRVDREQNPNRPGVQGS